MKSGDSNSEPLGLLAFDELADGYAAKVETKAHNAFYERPAMMALLPDVAGRRVLDAGCGPGVYAQRLLDRGADVVGLDVSPRMTELARERLGESARIIHADLDRPLDFLEAASFDVVLAPLVIDYVRDWPALFGEFHRLLRTGGRFVFSVEHPCSDYSQRLMSNYFETEIIECTWRGFERPVLVRSYRRPLSHLVNALVEAGFAIERMVEPRPVPEFQNRDPEDYAKLMKWPGFLCLRAISVDVDS